MTALTNEQAFAELYYSRKAIKDILGVTPLCWRPPFGDVDNRIRTIAQSLNLTTILWGYDSVSIERGCAEHPF
jgi:peptidoglycan/xylan/chitin deacetylase (PgdA/CDA1 family)